MLVKEFYVLFGNGFKLRGRPESIVYQTRWETGVWLRAKLRYGNNDNDWIIRSHSLRSNTNMGQVHRLDVSGLTSSGLKV